MYGVLVGCPAPEKDKGLRFVEGINHFTEISEENKRWYCSENPCSYVNMRGQVHTCDKSQLVTFDIEDAKRVLGGALYRVPVDKLREV